VTPQHFNILLVEDSSTDARLFEMALRETAPRVSLYWVATGSEAIDALKRQDRFKNILTVDVVVLDLNMPLTDGFETLSAIKKDAELAVKPVVVMSSSSNPEDIQRAYSLGANTYFVKPMTLDGTNQMTRCIARYWLEFAKLPSSARKTPA
jgi:CheY-like chemotaxis protein